MDDDGNQSSEKSNLGCTLSRRPNVTQCEQRETVVNRLSEVRSKPPGHFSQPGSTSPLVFAFKTVACSGFARAVALWISDYKLRYLFRIILSFFLFNLCAYLGCRSWKTGCEWLAAAIQLNPQSTLSILYLLTLHMGLCTFAMCFVRYHWGMPISIVMDKGIIGTSHLKGIARRRGKTVKQMYGHMKRFRDPGQLNPVFPNGWIPLIESSNVPIGEVVSAVALGERFCVFRGEDGEACVLDAYCPHMGADLSAGGLVVGNCIECPFHGWQFNGKDGRCEHIPYAKRIPDVAVAKKWNSSEKNGFIFVWYHAEGEDPSWEIPTLPEVETGKWLYRGRSDLTIECLIQEIPENGADIAHLSQIHARAVFLGSELVGDATNHLMQHEWVPQWSPDPERSHIARVCITQRMVFMGYEVPLTRVKMNIEQIGPATVYLQMECAFGRGVFLQHIIPEGPLSQRMVQLFYSERRFKQLPSNFFVWGEAVMVERDIAVWNNKKFLKNPILVSEDRLVKKFRRWYSQFFSPNSPTLEKLYKRAIDW